MQLFNQKTVACVHSDIKTWLSDILRRIRQQDVLPPPDIFQNTIRFLEILHHYAHSMTSQVSTPKPPSFKKWYNSEMKGRTTNKPVPSPFTKFLSLYNLQYDSLGIRSQQRQRLNSTWIFLIRVKEFTFYFVFKITFSKVWRSSNVWERQWQIRRIVKKKKLWVD
jgi:hypothetical protein